jgi:hypothetical protein
MPRIPFPSNGDIEKYRKYQISFSIYYRALSLTRMYLDPGCSKFSLSNLWFGGKHYSRLDVLNAEFRPREQAIFLRVSVTTFTPSR